MFMLSMNKTVFISSFPISAAFISFSYCISKDLWCNGRSGEKGHSHLLPGLSGKALSPLSTMTSDVRESRMGIEMQPS